MWIEGDYAIYDGVTLLADLEWDHGYDIEAVLNLKTGRLDIQEWLDDQQVCNQKNVTIEVVN
jgi:hypothetical protein